MLNDLCWLWVIGKIGILGFSLLKLTHRSENRYRMWQNKPDLRLVREYHKDAHFPLSTVIQLLFYCYLV